MKKLLICTLSALAVLTGCTKSHDYTPAATATGEEIFQTACSHCHKTQSGIIMTLDSEMANVNAITNKILTGSIAMPAFPNIQGEPAQKVAQYVLDNSKVE